MMNLVALKLAGWFDEILAAEKPELPLVAYRFGISETEEGYLLYLAGSKTHEEETDDWASEMPDLLVGEELEISQDEVGEWYFMLVHLLTFLGKELRKPIVQHSLLANKPVYAGFNDGDLIRLQ